MCRVVTVALLALSMIAAVPARDFTTGRLLDIRSTLRVIEGVPAAYELFRVQTGNFIDSAIGDRITQSRKEQVLSVDEPVQVSIEGNDLIILNPDGKETKMTITKRTQAR